MHNLRPCFGASILVQQWMECGSPRNWDDCLQILTPHGGCLPLCSPLVRLPVEAHISIAPVLFTEPLYCGVNAESLSCTPVIETPATLLCSENCDLCECIPMGHEILEDELPSPPSDDICRSGFVAWGAIGEVWGNYCDYRNLLPIQSVARQPVR